MSKKDVFIHSHTTGDPPQIEFTYKNCVYSYMFKPHVTFKILSTRCNIPIETFFHCSKKSLNSSVLMPFSASAVFCYLFHIGKKFPFKDYFHQGQQKKITQGEIRWIERVGHGDHAVFHQKLLNTQHSMGRCAPKSPIMKLTHTEQFSKKFTEAKCSLSQQHQLVHRYRWVPRTLP